MSFPELENVRGNCWIQLGALTATLMAACWAVAEQTSTSPEYELTGSVILDVGGQALQPEGTVVAKAEPEAADPEGEAAGSGSSPMDAVVFYILAAVAAGSALGCVLCVNIVRMAVCLFLTLSSVAVLYFSMAANFLGAIQLIVYAGGTLVVIIFGVMLTSKSPWVRYVPRPLEIVAGSVVCLVLFVTLAGSFLKTRWGASLPNPEGYEVAKIGEALLTTYLLPFEAASVLLLAAMIGAAFLARPEKK